MDKNLKDLGLQDAHTREQSNETREVLLTWIDGQTTETSREVLNKFKAIYGDNPKCKVEVRQ